MRSKFFLNRNKYTSWQVTWYLVSATKQLHDMISGELSRAEAGAEAKVETFMGHNRHYFVCFCFSIIIYVPALTDIILYSVFKSNCRRYLFSQFAYITSCQPSGHVAHHAITCISNSKFGGVVLPLFLLWHGRKQIRPTSRNSCHCRPDL